MKICEKHKKYIFLLKNKRGDSLETTNSFFSKRCVCLCFFWDPRKTGIFKKRKKKKSEKSREYVVRIVKYTYLYDHIQEIIYLSPHFSLCLINILNLIPLFIIIFDFQQQLRMFFNQLFLKLIKGIFVLNIIIIKKK